MKTKLWAIASDLLVLLGIACAAAAVQPANAGGEDALQYDPSEAAQRFNLIRLYVKTRVCMVDGSQAALRYSRSRSQVEAFTVKVCGAPIRNELVRHGEFTPDEADAMVRSLATKSLNEVLSR